MTTLRTDGLPPEPPEPPGAIACFDCGVEMPWKKHKGRWAFPGERCPECAERFAGAEAQRRVESALQLALVPQSYRGFSWQRTYSQAEGESPVDLWRRCYDVTPPAVGITLANRSVAVALYRWRPRHGSLWIQGPVGSGKTTLVAATLHQAVLEEGEPRFEEVPYGELPPRWRAHVDANGGRLPKRPAGGLSALWWAEHELQRAALRAVRDPSITDSPIWRAKAIPLLVLDDVGTAKTTETWTSEFESLLDTRYAAGRPTIFTSNMSPQDYARRCKSDRIASRLTEAVGGARTLTLDRTTDWRAIARDAR